MRAFLLTVAVLASVLTLAAPSPAAAVPAALVSHDALATILAQTGPSETVQYGEYRRRQAFRKRQQIRRREFRRRQAARRYYRY